MEKILQKKLDTACAVVCEYDPFHNGHLWQLSTLKERFSHVVLVMSGNFTQRGNAAILDKFTRAKIALENGADCVLELPVPFACANAETFARGAVKLLSAIPCVTHLAFGVERADGAILERVAEALVDEPPTFQAEMKRLLDGGASPAKAKSAALATLFPDVAEEVFSSPNDVLGLEYVKAIKRTKKPIVPVALPRQGVFHGAGRKGTYASASAIREGILSGDTAWIGEVAPKATVDALPLALSQEAYRKLDGMVYYALKSRSKEALARVADCTEGLENALKKSAETRFTAEGVIKSVTSARYTSARLRRILLLNALGVEKSATDEFLSNDLYLSPLAVRADFLAELTRSGLPVPVRKGDEESLSPIASACFAITERADGIYSALCQRKINPYATVVEREGIKE